MHNFLLLKNNQKRLIKGTMSQKYMAFWSSYCFKPLSKNYNFFKLSSSWCKTLLTSLLGLAVTESRILRSGRIIQNNSITCFDMLAVFRHVLFHCTTAWTIGLQAAVALDLWILSFRHVHTPVLEVCQRLGAVSSLQGWALCSFPFGTLRSFPF